MKAAIVIAAGKSERMGRPKALLPYRGVTFIEHILSTIRGSSLEQTVVVLGKDRDLISGVVELPVSVYNEDYELGMTTSFQKGIRALPAEVTGAMLFLVDHPFVSVGTIEALLAAEAGQSIVVPAHKGRRGHPVLFSKDVLEEVLALAPSMGANTIVRSVPDRVIEVEVEDPGILIDIDTPAQFEQWIGSESE